MTPRSEHRPIFVVGCQRSGTTLFRLILDSHPNISCGPETRFLQGFDEDVLGSGWPRMSLYGFEREYWVDQFADLFHNFQMTYAEKRGKSRWADKTPLYVKHVPLLDELFPTCQIIHIIRDPRDVVASHHDRWGWFSGVKAAEKWPRYVTDAREASKALPPERYLEIRYEQLIADTKGTMATVLEFLGEPWDDAVLHHDEHPHDVMDRYRSFSSARRQQDKTGNDGAIYKQRVGAGKKKNGPVLKTLIRMRAGNVMRELGYR